MKNIKLILLSFLIISTAFGRAANNVYIMPSSGSPLLPTWGHVNLASSSAVTGLLSPTFGGTGQNFSASSGALSVSSGTVSAGNLSTAFGGTGANLSASTGTLIDTAGTITAGVAIPQYGGTGQNLSASTGAILVTSGTVSAGTLPNTMGGTGQGSAFTQFGVTYANATTTLATTAAGNAGQVLTSNSSSAPTFQTSAVFNQPTALVNTGILASVSGNALTVALKQSDGATNPSTGTSAVGISFISSTVTLGAFNQRTVTGALSIVTPASGATFGLTSNVNQYIYVYALDNAGTVELALSGSVVDEGTVQSTTILNASSTNINVLYSTTARTNVPVRLIGRLLSNQVTSGVYASAISASSPTPLTRNSIYAFLSLTGSTANGGTNTSVVRWTTATTNLLGTAATFTASAANGDSVTINEAGVYSISASFGVSGGSDWGITRNTTSSIASILDANLLAVYENPNATGQEKTITYVGPLLNGDIVRLNVRGTGTFTSNDGYPAQFRLTQLFKF